MPAGRVNRYVVSELATPTLLGVVLWLFVLLMNQFFVVAGQMLAKNLSGELTLRLFLAGVPVMLLYALPMSALLGTLIGVGRLSADHEWVAMQSAGQGPRRLLWPAALLGLLWTALGWYVYGEIVPRASYQMRTLRGEVFLSDNLAADLKPRTFYTDLANTVLFVDEIKAGSGGQLEGVLAVRPRPEGDGRVLIFARRGDLFPSPDRSGALVLDVEDGTLHTLDESADASYRLVQHFDEMRDRIEPESFVSAFLEPPEPTLADMRIGGVVEAYREAIDADRVARETGVDEFQADFRLNRATVELHQRIALPFAALAFALLAVPLGVTRVRSGKGAGFAISLLVVLLYWATFTLARNQANLGRIPAELGVWAGNLVILPWAAVAIWRMRQPPRATLGPLARVWRLLGRGLSALRPGRRRRHRQDSDEPTLIEEMTEIGPTGNRFVGRIDRYVIGQYLRILLLSVAGVYLVYGLVELKGLVDDALRHNQPLSLIVDYFAYFAPGVLDITLPISCLIGAVVAFTVLTRTGELTAMKAIGISMRRATVPVLVVSALLSVVLFVVQDRIVPLTNLRLEAVSDQIRGKPPRSHGFPLENRWAFGPDGARLYHYRLYDPGSGTFYGFRVLTLDRDAVRILDHRYAETARYDPDEGWIVGPGWHRTFPASGPARFESWTERRIEGLAQPSSFFGEQAAPGAPDDLARQLSVEQLSERIGSLEARGYDATTLRVALHGKIARSATPLVMVLLGLPFAFRVGRRGSLYGIGIALVVVLVYWAVLAMFNALGSEAFLDARIAAWAPNILFALVGAYMMLFIRT